MAVNGDTLVQKRPQLGPRNTLGRFGCFSSGKKNKTQTKLFVRISSGRVGVFHVKDGGQKVRYVLPNPGQANFRAGYPGTLAGYPGGGQKV